MSGSPVEKIYKYANQPLWKVPNWGQSFKLGCSVCGRDLPESMFRLVEASKTALLYGVTCKSCRRRAYQKTRVDTAHPLYTDELLAFVKKVFRSARSGAYSRKLNFTITEEFVMELYFKQNGLCALTGQKLEYSPKKRGMLNISIDRIDSDGGYEPCNVQLVCFRVNLMKSDMPMDTFVRWCESVVETKMLKETRAA